MDALEVLLAQDSFKDITITKLCNEAKLSRPAFYQNFDSINALAQKCVAMHAQQSYSRIGLRRVKSSEELASLFIDIMSSDSDFVNMMISQGLEDIVSTQYAEAFAKTDQVLRTLDSIKDPYIKSYHATFISAGCASCLTRWIAEDTRLTRSEITDVLVSMIDSSTPVAAAQAEETVKAKIG